MDKNKICFIICANDRVLLNESFKYINRLYVPNNYYIDILSIGDAESMASGYNEGMKASDAKYKIYMHQDVFIVNRYFLFDILKVFESDRSIGMIGVVGAVKLSIDGCMWFGNRVGKIAGFEDDCCSYEDYRYDISEGVLDVVCVDGCLIATQHDLPWREDLFDKWDFYDISQGFEFKITGYRVVVPEQRNAWVVHDSKFSNISDYNTSRHKFLKEYSKYEDYFE